MRRYKFLAFDFDENVEMTKDNCRLLLVRLKMEGWLIGTSKVFLKYYNEEYLARLYETQVKKIIKVQSMMRAFLAKKTAATRFKQGAAGGFNKAPLLRLPSKDMNQEEAVVKIQTAFRGCQIRKIYGPLINQKTGKIDIATAKFIEPFAARWKRKSIFQILLQYRSIRHMDLVNFSQQVHIYNQRMVTGLTTTSNCILMEKINPKELLKEQLGPLRRAVWKIPFRLDEIPFFDTTFLCEPAQPTHFTSYEEETEPWDAPLRRRNNVSSHISSHMYQNNRRESHYSEIGSDDGMLVNEPFSRDPNVPLKKIKARRYDASPRPSVASAFEESNNEPRPFCYSPTPYSVPSVGNLRAKFSDGNAPGDKMMKKRAPKPPGEFEDLLEQRQGAKKGPAPQRPISPYRAPIIKEMEKIGKKEDVSGGDEPPFNFQSMLRKTKYNRNSMKRSGDGKLSLPQDDYNNNSESYVETSSSYSTVVFHSKGNDRAKSPQLRKNSPSPSTGSRNGNLDENLNFIQEEIAPGIVIEGYVADL